MNKYSIAAQKYFLNSLYILQTKQKTLVEYKDLAAMNTAKLHRTKV
jgi:hypothetical protein